MTDKRDYKLGSIQVLKLMGRLTIYYAVIFGLLYLVLKLFPWLQDYMPFGKGPTLSNIEITSSFRDLSNFTNLSSDYRQNGLNLLLAVLGVIQVMLPVSWVYLKSRVRKGLDQSLVHTMLLLPVIVAGVVIIVQNSIALAFSLAGIVAAVRFRNTLKNTGDSIFIFTAIGSGLAAGVRVLEIAIVVTVVFNYVYLILWDLDYGSRYATKFMRGSNEEDWPEEGESSSKDNSDPPAM